MKKILISLTAILALAGCKTTITKDVSLTGLLNGPLKQEAALLEIEVASCGKAEDSRQASENLVEVQNKIPELFNGATFKECYRKNAESFASFEIPVGVGNTEKESETHDSFIADISIVSSPSQNIALGLFAKKEFRERLAIMKKQNFMLSSLKLNIQIKLNADLDNAPIMSFYGVYLNNKPFTFVTGKLSKGKNGIVRLSDVASDQLVLNNEDGGMIKIAEFVKE